METLGGIMQQKLFEDEPDRKTFTKITLDSIGEPQVNPDPVKTTKITKLFTTDETGATVQKFDDTGMIPEPKKPWEIKREEFEKEWKYGCTSVFQDSGEWRFVGDIDHCGEEAIFYNALKIRQHLQSKGLNYGHMNYNDPPEYSRGFDKKGFERDQPIYKFDIYGWNAQDNPIMIKQYGEKSQLEQYNEWHKDDNPKVVFSDHCGTHEFEEDEDGVEEGEIFQDTDELEE